MSKMKYCTSSLTEFDVQEGGGLQLLKGFLIQALDKGK
jgi:hypothetical protein